MQHPSSDPFRTPAGRRHHGMDWLRIGAFGGLILYHIGMVFAPWPWVVKASPTHAWLIAPMALVSPWRLALLFAVSGYASARLRARAGGTGAFLRSRARRLLVPLAFGMAVLVPVEMWVQVRQNGYPHGYLTFWASDYWRVGPFWGRSFPSWEHLWFVAYLFAYTLLLGGVLWVAGVRADRWCEAAAGWLARGHRLLWLPVAALVAAKLALMFVVPERQGLFTDWGGHAEYLPMIAFGFVAGTSGRLWPALARAWRPALGIAAAAGTIVVAVEIAYPAAALPPHGVMAAQRAARVAMAWTMTIALFHLAHAHLDRDHRWRRPLAEGVFPAYLFHHPAIVLTAWWLLPLKLPPAALFAVLLGTTVSSCAAAWLVGRRVGWLRPLIGLAPVRPGRSRGRGDGGPRLAA